MKELSLDKNFLSSINFFEDILFLNSFDNEKRIYSMFVDYLKKENHYELMMNIKENDVDILNTKCTLANKLNGGKVLNDIIKLVTNKYKSDLIIDVKELDSKNNCVKFGRRKYSSKVND